MKKQNADFAKSVVDIEALRATQREALLAGADTTTLRADIARFEREQREAAEARARAAEEAAQAESEVICREATRRAEQSATRLQTLLKSFEV